MIHRIHCNTMSNGESYLRRLRQQSGKEEMHQNISNNAE